MKPIPASLLSRLSENEQTKFKDADPRIFLMFQRTARYIEQGAMMQAFTVDDTPPSLGSWDLAMRRENHLTGPDYMYKAHIDDGQVYVSRVPWATLLTAMSEEPGLLDADWEDLGLIGATGAIDCAIEFNGEWVRTSKDAEVCFDSPAQWTHITYGEPYVFWVDSSGALHTQQLGESAVELVASGVTKISAIRGWKNVYRWNHDHGLIIAYVKSGAVYYRTFANQGTEETPLPPAWESEREVTELPTPAQDVAVFRTNDFRTGFLCESEGEIHWTITDRNWAGMAIVDHTITVTGTELLADFIAIDYEDGHTEHTITVTGTEVSALYCPAIWPEELFAYMPGAEIEEIEYFLSATFPATFEKIVSGDFDTIYIACSLPLYGDLVGKQAGFTVTDTLSTNFAVTATCKKADDDTTIMLTVADFETAVGNLTVTYTHSAAPIYAQVEGGCLMELDDFSITFDPGADPPAGWSEHTITVEGTEVLVDFIETDKEDGHSEHTLTVSGTEVFVDLIKVEDIPP